MSAQVTVVGAGLAGLACALTLQESGVEVVVLEASNRVGGRVQSEIHEGYTLDVGFQVLLTGYPAARDFLNFEALDLRCFPAGALIHRAGKWHTYADPLRQPNLLWKTLQSPIGTLTDKLRLGWLRACLLIGTVNSLPGESTLEFLRRWGFSRGMITTFFSPFFGGVFLESDLRTSAHKFLQLFHLFSISSAAVPALGMGAIPKQLARRLVEAPRLSTPVEALEGTSLVTPHGRLSTDCVVLAGPGPESLFTGHPTSFHPAFTYYFSCPEPSGVPTMLMLDADPGPINNIASLSRVAPYAPPGRTLVAVSVLEHACCSQEVEASLFRLLPADWSFVKAFVIEQALPEEPVELVSPSQLSDRIFACGDQRCSGSIQGALESGRLAALAVLQKRPWLNRISRGGES